MKCLILLLALLCGTAQAAVTVYEQHFDTSASGWFMARNEGYGQPGFAEDALVWVEGGYVRSWSVYPRLWWPDANHTCYWPYFDPAAMIPALPPCTSWLSLVAMRRNAPGESLDFRNITVSIKTRMRTCGDPDKIMAGTCEAGAISYGRPLMLHVQGTCNKTKACNFVAMNSPITPSYDWKVTTFTVNTDAWTCLGSSHLRKDLYDCAPASDVLANINLSWGFMMVGIDPRFIPLGSIEIDDIVITRN